MGPVKQDLIDFAGRRVKWTDQAIVTHTPTWKSCNCQLNNYPEYLYDEEC